MKSDQGRFFWSVALRFGHGKPGHVFSSKKETKVRLESTCFAISKGLFGIICIF
jgi:hypothetical protein